VQDKTLSCIKIFNACINACVSLESKIVKQN